MRKFLILALMLTLVFTFISCEKDASTNYMVSEDSSSSTSSEDESSSSINNNENSTILESEGLEFVFDTETNSYAVSGIGTCKDENIVIPSTYGSVPVSSIKEEAFRYCNSIKSVTIPESITVIGDRAFYRCESLTSVNIGDGVKTIDTHAFTLCSSLTDLKIGKGVTKIKSFAFSDCRSLPSIDIPDNVVSLGEDAFNNCDSLKSVTIGNGITSIRFRTFYACHSLESISLPDTLTTIEGSAFTHCHSLKTIKLPDNVTHIGYSAFKECSSLVKIDLPKNLYSIEGFAFSSCTSLVSITIPDTLTFLGDYVFNACPKLVEIYNLSSFNIRGSNFVGEAIHASLDEPSILETVNDFIFMTFENKHYLMGYIGTDAELTLPDDYNGNCYGIHPYAFYGDDQITKVEIPNGVTSIGAHAFENSELFNVNIPNSVVFVGEKAFYASPCVTSGKDGFSYYVDKWLVSTMSIRTPNIQSDTIGIAQGAFLENNSLISLIIPSNVKFINEGAFDVYNEWLKIYCEAPSQPNSWDSNWNNANRPVYWYSSDEPATDDNYWHYGDNGEIIVWD